MPARHTLNEPMVKPKATIVISARFMIFPDWPTPVLAPREDQDVCHGREGNTAGQSRRAFEK